MRHIAYFDPADRQREKQLARARDDYALGSGLISRDELRAANGILSSLDLRPSSLGRRRQSG
jgi:hypothetical protein